MRKLLQINTNSAYGSIGKITEQISLLAESCGWKCYLAVGTRHSKPSHISIIKFDILISEYFHYLYSLLFDAQGRGFASFFETKYLIKQIKRIDPDIIHIHNLHGSYINYNILFRYLRKTEKPVVWTLHDCWAFTGHCVYYDFVDCSRWINGCYDCPKRAKYPKSLFLDRSSYNYNLKKELFTSLSNLHIVTVSDWLKREVKKSYLSKFDIQKIYNGVDLDVFKFNPNSNLNLHSDSKHVLLAVANGWGIRKGFYDYFKLRELLPIDYKIVLVGIGNDQGKDFPNGLIGIKRTNSIQELVDYYSEADIILNLSYEETMGMTTVEGLACGKPSILYDRTASPELIDKNTGVVIKAGDIEGVANAVKAICNGEIAISGIECRERAKLLFEKEMQYNKYLTLYKDIINYLER